MSNIHFKAQSGWINDPNGLCFFQGKYHLFYQYFPYDLKWGTMHWGHATTTDFISYEHHPIALFPSVCNDQNGVFSGSALVEKNEMHLFYTGVKYNNYDQDIHRYGDKLFESRQLHISSVDGYTFDNFNGKQTIIEKLERPAGDPIHTRDPKVWKKDNMYYLLLGSNVIVSGVQQGAFLIYSGDRIDNLQQICQYTKSDLGHMWECPDYFEIGKVGFALMSPEGTMTDCAYQSHVYIGRADFDYKQKFEFVSELQLVDIGLDCYAPQTFLDENGNRTLISWLRMPKTMDGKTIGCLTMPRIIRWINGHITYEVHPLIANRFTNVKNVVELEPTQTYKFDVQLDEGQFFYIGKYKITCTKGVLTFDRSLIFPLDDIKLKQISMQHNKCIQLEIYYDHEVIETFINDGNQVCTHVLYSNTNKLATNAKYKTSVMD